MKNETSIYLALIFIFIFSGFASAQVNEKDAKTTTESFFSLCKKNNFKESSKLLAYLGTDNARLYNDVYNANNPDEYKVVRRICKKINATLLISDSYSFGKFGNKDIRGKKVQFLEVQFSSGSQKIKHYVYFIEIKNKVVIFDYN